MSVVNTEKKQEFFFVLSVYLLLDYSLKFMPPFIFSKRIQWAGLEFLPGRFRALGLMFDTPELDGEEGKKRKRFIFLVLISFKFPRRWTKDSSFHISLLCRNGPWGGDSFRVICGTFLKTNLQHVTDKSPLWPGGLTFQDKQSGSVVCGLKVTSCD